MDIVNMILGTSGRRQKAEDMAYQAHLERIQKGQMRPEESEAVRIKTLSDMGYAPATLRQPAQVQPAPAAPVPPPVPTAAQGYQNQQDNRRAVEGIDLSTGKMQPLPMGGVNPENNEVLDIAGLRRRPVVPPR